MLWAAGDDGDIQAGATLAYVDNGDGTITDLNTGLMWEKKTDDGGLHDKDDGYLWGPGAGSIWMWIAQVNAEGGTGFAGYSDWRVPNAKELQSILDHGRQNPSVDPVFHSACGGGCTVFTCSCMVLSYYWSSTTNSNNGQFAWAVGFAFGRVVTPDKNSVHYARAVRAGL